MGRALATCLLVLALGHLAAPAMAAGERYRAWAGDRISEWEANGTHERGADATELDIAGLRLFMTYDAVIRRLEETGRPFEVSAMRRVPCAGDRIEYATSDERTGAHCIDFMEMALDLGGGERAHIKAYFGEDVYDAPGSNMLTRIEYTKTYGERSVELDEIYAELKDKYGHEPAYPHLRYFIGHFVKLDAYPEVESELELPYLRMYLGSVSPVDRYSLVLSAGEALRKDLEAEADRLVREATPNSGFRLPWGM
jgi:hypothetical protein